MLLISWIGAGAASSDCSGLSCWSITCSSVGISNSLFSDSCGLSNCLSDGVWLDCSCIGLSYCSFGVSNDCCICGCWFWGI